MVVFLDNLWGALKIAFFLISAPIARLFYNRWGATAEEVNRALPGDDIAPQPRLAYTRAITINAPPAAVWPWLIQLGQGRAGLYSYDGLENIAGCAMHSADQIHPEWALQVGDYIEFGPPGKNYPALQVVTVEREKALVAQGADPKTRELGPAFTAYILEARPNQSTRLIIRSRNGFSGGWAISLLWHVVEPLNFVMEVKQMRGIKRRAERAWAEAQVARRSAPAM